VDREHVETLRDYYAGAPIRVTTSKNYYSRDLPAVVFLCTEGGEPLALDAEALKSALDRLGVL
jgi:hypothetical protein